MINQQRGMFMKTKYMIGEMAKIFCISTDTLRHYDKMDLFKPSIIEDNGYRYYTPQQFDILYMILSLKGLEIPLSTIKDIITTNNRDLLLQVIEEQEKQLDFYNFYIQSLSSSIKKLKNQLINLEDFNDEIIIKQSPEFYCISSEITGDYSKNEFDMVEFSKLYQHIDNNILSISSFGLVTDYKKVYKKNYLVSYALLSQLPLEGDEVKHYPSTECAYSVFKGTLDDAMKKYESMLLWIYTNGYELSNDIIERSIESIHVNIDDENYLSEIWMPIKKK